MLGLKEETQVPYDLPGVCVRPPRYPWEMKMSLKLASSPLSELQTLVTRDTAPHFCVLWRLKDQVLFCSSRGIGRIDQRESEPVSARAGDSHPPLENVLQESN